MSRHTTMLQPGDSQEVTNHAEGPRVPILITPEARAKLIDYLMNEAPRGEGYSAFILRAIKTFREQDQTTTNDY